MSAATPHLSTLSSVHQNIVAQEARLSPDALGPLASSVLPSPRGSLSRFGRGVDYNDIFHVVTEEVESGSLPYFEPVTTSPRLVVGNAGMTVTNTRDKEWSTSIAAPGHQSGRHYWELHMRELHSPHVMVMVGVVDWCAFGVSWISWGCIPSGPFGPSRKTASQRLPPQPPTALTPPRRLIHAQCAVPQVRR